MHRPLLALLAFASSLLVPAGLLAGDGESPPRLDLEECRRLIGAQAEPIAPDRLAGDWQLVTEARLEPDTGTLRQFDGSPLRFPAYRLRFALDPARTLRVEVEDASSRSSRREGYVWGPVSTGRHSLLLGSRSTLDDRDRFFWDESFECRALAEDRLLCAYASGSYEYRDHRESDLGWYERFSYRIYVKASR